MSGRTLQILRLQTTTVWLLHKANIESNLEDCSDRLAYLSVVDGSVLRRGIGSSTLEWRLLGSIRTVFWSDEGGVFRRRGVLLLYVSRGSFYSFCWQKVNSPDLFLYQVSPSLFDQIGYEWFLSLESMLVPIFEIPFPYKLDFLSVIRQWTWRWIVHAVLIARFAFCYSGITASTGRISGRGTTAASSLYELPIEHRIDDLLPLQINKIKT